MADRAVGPLDRRLLAALAFAGHVFGLWLVGYRLGAAKTPLNRLALAATALAMVAGGFAGGAWGVLVAWLVGHFGWSMYLARSVLRGEAGFPP